MNFALRLQTTVLLLFVAIACFSQQVADRSYGKMLKGLLSHSVNEISVEEAKELKNVTWVDAREREEFMVSTILGAYWSGYNDFNRDRIKSIPKDSKIIVYCSVGYRSEKVAEKLKAMGYLDVSNLYGGIFEWVNDGNTVHDPTGLATTKVHAYDQEWGRWLKSGDKVYK